MQWRGLTLFILSSSILNSVQFNPDCSYETCPPFRNDVINVHLICHTHLDAGWLRTFKEYYEGNKFDSTDFADGVRDIFNSVLKELLVKRDRKFTFSEIGFFSEWWSEVNETVKQNFRRLLNTGQIEFSGGGWVQHDEATPYYADMIDQMTAGHRFLTKSFGNSKCAHPKTAWQLDPFGHSTTSADLFAHMGFEALFFSRIHYADRKKRQQEKTMEFEWFTNSDPNKPAKILTGVNFEHYTPPSGFCFDQACSNFETENADELAERVDYLVQHAEQQAASFATNHIMLMMGGDFHYTNATKWYRSLDQIIAEANRRARSQINVFYSTPACYTRALKASKINFPAKYDDFFPYAHETTLYWTGYFTSRPLLKRFTKVSSNVLKVCRVFSALTGIGGHDQIETLRRAVHILQHHDGISGTATQRVTDDYMRMLSQGVAGCQDVLGNISKQLSVIAPDFDVPRRFCSLVKGHPCKISSDSEAIVIGVFNGLSKSRLSYVRMMTNRLAYVRDHRGKMVPSQINGPRASTKFGTEADLRDRELFFQVKLPPLSYSEYLIHISNTANVESSENEVVEIPSSEVQRKQYNDNDDFTIENEFLRISFDHESGLTEQITDKSTNQTTRIRQNFFAYGNDGGAYIFSTQNQSALPVVITAKAYKIAGGLVQEMRQNFGDWISQTVRLYKSKNYVEFEWNVGPIPYSNDGGLQIVTRYATDIQNGGYFYTDSNGKQILQRRRNFQPTYNYVGDIYREGVSSNYYPVVSSISINEKHNHLTVITDRSQGGSSLRDGSIELMLHRRITLDDGQGMGEGLLERGPDGQGLRVNGRHWLFVGQHAEFHARKRRLLSVEMQNEPIVISVPLDRGVETRFAASAEPFSGIQKALPDEIHLLSMYKDDNGKLIVRLEHVFDVGRNEETSSSKLSSFSFKNLFPTLKIQQVEELSLNGRLLENQPKFGKLDANYDWRISMQPGEIKTFEISLYPA